MYVLAMAALCACLCTTCLCFAVANVCRSMRNRRNSSNLYKGGYFLQSDLDSPNDDQDSDALGSESDTKNSSFLRKKKTNGGLGMDLKKETAKRRGVGFIFSSNKA